LDRTGAFEHLVLVFSPGAVGTGALRDVALTDVRAMFEGKFFPYLHAVQRAEVTESITFISAASARAAVPGSVTFAAVNGAIERIVPPLAAELAPIRVNAVSPGLVDTPFWSFLPEEHRQAQFAAAAESVPTKRVGRAEDVAQAVSYLIGATYVTGTILPVDGGYTVA
jgi:NAD(P)-dependent dehydrogenase (short-subunit alcohol dehydrogenase family)